MERKTLEDDPALDPSLAARPVARPAPCTGHSWLAWRQDTGRWRHGLVRRWTPTASLASSHCFRRSSKLGGGGRFSESIRKATGLYFCPKMTRTVSTTEKNQPRASQNRQTDDGVQWKIDTHNTTKAARPQLCDRAKGAARFLRLRRVFSPTATTNNMVSVSVDVYSYSFLNGMVSAQVACFLVLYP